MAMICREALIMVVQSMPWRIVARKLEDAKTYEEELEYYTWLFENEDGGYDIHTELICQDALDLPFGAASELGWEGDDPGNNLAWFKHMDGATLFPTYSRDYPVGQHLLEQPANIVYFPDYAVSRMHYTPRPEIRRQGWGMAPPEKIYLAMELLFRGDQYYANLLLDTPEAGILDLGDASYEGAKAWLEGWRALLTGPDPYKVPVIAEHTVPTNWIGFTRSPVEMMFDKAISRYSMIVAAGYGISLSDIGESFVGGANTLAAAIRQERRTKRTGLGTLEKKLIAYRNRQLPKYLKFEFIDLDEELLVAKGRARLANSMALSNLVTNGIISPSDAQEQLIADGLLTVPLTSPETIAADQAKLAASSSNGTRPKQQIREIMQDPVPASEGGMGEIK